MSKVAIVMGSDSDLSTMRAAGDFLTKMGIEYEYNKKKKKICVFLV